MTQFAMGALKLVPLNPILVRVVTAGGRRIRHALVRWIYLGLLIGVLLVALMVSSIDKKGLSELAKASTNVFAWISFVQLGMICLLAPVFTAGAITQERDSRTYNILLATPLSNAQIVLGSLLSRLYYVVALLLAGVPVFAITLFYGGVTAMNIVLSFAIALSTALFMGAMAITIAVFRLGTGKTVFWFFVFNVVYLVSLFVVDVMTAPAVGGSGTGTYTTWLTGIHPFLALQAVVMPTTYSVPWSEIATLPTVLRWYRGYPAYAYVTLTTAGSLAMIVPSALVLRRISQRSDVGLWEYLRHLILPKLENKSRRARRVWANPVAWREAATRAGASARGITRYLTVIVGLLVAGALIYYYHIRWAELAGRINDLAEMRAEIRLWLVGLVAVEFSVALLVATNTSASAVTRERESQTLDLLLVTPITSRYYIWGKLRGLVSFMLPFAAVPALAVFLMLVYDTTRGNLFSDPVVFPKALVLLPVFLTVLIATACMLGLQLSLKWSRTIVAVMVSVGILAGACAAMGACGYPALKVPGFGLVFNAFSPFTGICVLLAPTRFAPDYFAAVASSSYSSSPAVSSVIGPIGARVMLFVSFLISSAVYCLLVWTMYRSMVKNFDMIIRRQHQ